MRLKGNLSLTRRLTFLVTLASSAVLLSLGFVITQSVERHFEDLDMVGLVGKMDLIAQPVNELKTSDDLNRLALLMGHSLVGHQGLEVLVIDPANQTLFATAQVAADPVFSSRLLLVNASRYPEQPLRPMLWTVGDQQFRVVVAELATQLPGTVVPGEQVGLQRDVYRPFTVRVAIASDTEHHQVYLQTLLKTLWVFVAGATVLIALLGWVAVRSGLRPLRAMREQTSRVTAQQLDYRLPVDTVPRELAELAQSLNDMLARLQEAFQRLSDFSSDIAHELRTPVSNLMTETQVALTRARSADEYHHILESNAEELERMKSMIADMLLLAKADNGLVLPHREPVDLAAEILALFDFYDALAEEKHLTLSLQGQAKVLADRLMLRRAIGNLLSNAIRHAQRNSCIRVTLQDQASEATVTVENVGDTIPAEFLERIFDRFFRADPARQRGEGTGLGLAIAKSIVVAHGGDISVTSSDASTRFIVRLAHAQESV
ncbi:heavy metal sensor histidine kinase [Rhodoferax sp.]|uniref:heavy metal sensor histidine kinase n=1 Tax=Rhodoferax sp. TaxID=50421 RepID=UPI001A0D0CE1|nr:heavy metal sensor histidine kinase [Rhodoferax sp.]MBE0474145.1 heavy metal sensor histidine kinase [Rhodoferax sp.]